MFFTSSLETGFLRTLNSSCSQHSKYPFACGSTENVYVSMNENHRTCTLLEIFAIFWYCFPELVQTVIGFCVVLRVQLERNSFPSL